MVFTTRKLNREAARSSRRTKKESYLYGEMRAIYCYVQFSSSCGSALECQVLFWRHPVHGLHLPHQNWTKISVFCSIFQYHVGSNTQNRIDREKSKTQCTSSSQDNFVKMQRRYQNTTVTWIQMYSYTTPRKSEERGNHESRIIT